MDDSRARQQDAGVSYLYICGSGHSGSTLLEMHLAGHPDMVAVGELQNLAHQITIGRVCSCGRLPRDCGRWQAIAKKIEEHKGVDIFERPFAFRMSRERPRTTTENLIRLWNRSCYYLHFSGRNWRRIPMDRLVLHGATMRANNRLVAAIVREISGAQIVIDSSKDYVRMREIYDYKPRGAMKIVYMCRDGRGCVWSSVKRGQSSALPAAKEWAINQKRTRRMLAGVAPEDQLLVRYEDYCAEVSHSLQRICTFLGVPFRSEMLQLAPEEHHTIAGNQIRVQRRMSVKTDDEWRRKMPPADLKVFDRLAGDENRRLGYDD